MEIIFREVKFGWFRHHTGHQVVLAHVAMAEGAEADETETEGAQEAPNYYEQ